MPAVGGASKLVRLELSPEYHAKLRVVAASKGLTMAAFARRVVERAVREGLERLEQRTVRRVAKQAAKREASEGPEGGEGE